jgi:hypothetical protein
MKVSPRTIICFVTPGRQSAYSAALPSFLFLICIIAALPLPQSRSNGDATYTLNKLPISFFTKECAKSILAEN